LSIGFYKLYNKLELRPGFLMADTLGTMGTIAVINATNLTEYATQSLHNGKSAFERVCDFAHKQAAVDRLLILAATSISAPPQAEVQERESWSMLEILEACSGFATRYPDSDALVYVHADAPLYDTELTGRLLSLHRKYRAEYTFADGYPPGFAPELIHPRILPSLVHLASRHHFKADRDGLFNIIQKDINSYDIETELSPRDVRSCRFNPVCDSRRNLAAVERLLDLGITTAGQVVQYLPDHPELLRTLPAFLWVQITEGCVQSCSYCPYPAMVGDPRSLHGFMPAERFKLLVDQAVALCDELVIDVSLWGEPALHPDFFALANIVLAHPRTTLLVETCGLGWDRTKIDELMAKAGSRLHWIIGLDSSDPTMYSLLRGDGLPEAQQFAESLSRAFPAQTHIQAVRMQENEENLESFYRGWIKLNDKVIIQKYDSFAASLPERQVADLSPLQRLPCRHLARDMAVLLDGRVPVCKHGLVNTGMRLEYPSVVGNVFEEELGQIWHKLEAYYHQHCAGIYPVPCEKCDEYHTFNA